MAEEAKGHWVKARREDVLRTHPHLAEFLPFLDVLNGESPRGRVLVAASHLEHLLFEILNAFMIEGKSREQILNGFNAPVATFSAKIALCAALGLINERERAECELIRKIRNKFAHNVHATFDDDSIKDLSLSLSFRIEGENAVGAFTSAAVMLATNLTNRPHYVRLERLTLRPWKL